MEEIVAIEKTEVKVAPAPVKVAPEQGISVEVCPLEEIVAIEKKKLK